VVLAARLHLMSFDYCGIGHFRRLLSQGSRRRRVAQLGMVAAVTGGGIVFSFAPLAVADSAYGVGTVAGGGGSSIALAGPLGDSHSVAVSGYWGSGASALNFEAQPQPLARPDYPPEPGPIPGLVADTLEKGLITCEATASAGAVATGITVCVLDGSDGSTFRASDDATPGPADATASGAALLSPIATYHLCFAGDALFSDGTYIQSELHCY
jgi:hypothetical protein